LLFTLGLLLLSPSLAEGREVKPKAPVASETLLREAREAYQGYRFASARTAIEKYITTQERRRQAIPESARQLQAMIARAERMYPRAESLRIVDSIVVAKQTWLEHLEQAGGTIRPEEGLLGGDSLMRQASYRDALGRNWIRPTSTGLEWLSAVGDHWEKQALSTKALGEGTELAYPFLLEDGITLVYGRRTTQGLGGYDLYMTRLSGQGMSFLEPTLLGMPYNSPYNDYLLAYHESEDWGVLVSDRFCPADSVHLYRFIGKPSFLSGESQSEVDSLGEEAMQARASLRGLLYKGSVVAKQTKGTSHEGEIYFLLQGSRVYRHWSDFSSKEALEAYRVAETERKSVEERREHLRELRATWQSASEQERESLKTEILLLETQLRELETQLRERYNAVRRLEGVN
jgi:hypothetical protein